MIARAYEAAYNQSSQQSKNNYDETLLKETDAQNKEYVRVKQSIQIKDDKVKRQKELTNKFSLGDSVTVYPDKEIGVVYALANSKGDFGVIIKRKKQWINHKRLKLLVPAGELYPEGYDMSIVFDTVANRKARKIMGKRHDPDAVIKIRE